MKARKIHEIQNFKRGENPHKQLGIGAYNYPDWAKDNNDYLDPIDYADLQQIWDYIQDNDIEKARSMASHIDTIVREEIPQDIWYGVLFPELKRLHPKK